MASFNGTGSVQAYTFVALGLSTKLHCGHGLHYTNVGYTEPVALKYGKLATKYSLMNGYISQCGATAGVVSKRARQISSQHAEAGATGTQRQRQRQRRRRRRFRSSGDVRRRRRSDARLHRSLGAGDTASTSAAAAAAGSPPPRTVEVAGKSVRPQLHPIHHQRRTISCRRPDRTHHDGLRPSPGSRRRIHVHVRRCRISCRQLLALVDGQHLPALSPLFVSTAPYTQTQFDLPSYISDHLPKMLEN